MTDLHCHILPGLDDGAFSIDESLMMAESAYESGTRGIVCTPHNGPYGITELRETFDSFSSALESAGIPIAIYPAQEIYLTENYARQIRDIESGYHLTVNGTRYVLVEFSPYAHFHTMRSATERLSSVGLIPIIAHPERYEAIVEDIFLAERLKSEGALLQLNKGSLKGSFGHDSLSVASELLDERIADFIASDAHSPYERTPRLREVHAYISERYSIDYADRLLVENPARVVADKPVYSYS